MNFILMEVGYLKSPSQKINFLGPQSDRKLPFENVQFQVLNNFFQANSSVKNIFQKNYGQIRLEELRSGVGIVYSFELPKEIEQNLYQSGQTILKNNGTELKKEIDKIYNLFFFEQWKNIVVLSTAIWLVKDSCVQEKNTYFITKSGYQSSNSIEMPYTLADGGHETVSLTDEELQQVEENYFLLYPIMTKPILGTPPPVTHHSERASTIENDKLDRSKESSFVRALISLQNARRSGQLTVKIDFYMQVLQCIYALEGMKSTKIEKTLQEITANLLNLDESESREFADIISVSKNNDTNNERQQSNIIMDKIIQMGFRIRSKHSHGNKVTYSAKEIEHTAIAMDNYVRRVLQMVLLKPELDYNTKAEAQKVSKYFRKLVK